MSDSLDVLRLRVLLCFIREDDEDCTVMGISRILGEEHYKISRIMTSLEKEGLITKETPRKPILTEYGKKEAYKLSERIQISMRMLLSAGINEEKAERDAYLWAMYNTDETMGVIKEVEEKQRIRLELSKYKSINGAVLCRKLRDGDYKFPFVIYRESVKNGTNISMSNEGFEHPCTLSIKNGQGFLKLRRKELVKKSGFTGIKMHGYVDKVKYFDNGSYISAEWSGEVATIPASVLTFQSMGTGVDNLLHGTVSLKMRSSVGVVHMPESKAIFTLLI